MIKIKNVAKSFQNRHLYRDLNLEISTNKLNFIIGESGSGKTTLINLIGGIEKVNSGSIEFETENKKVNLQKKNSKFVDYIFQDFNLFNDLTVLENLKVSRKILGFKFNKSETAKRLNTVGLDESILKLKASELSGGEQQRLAIFRSLEKGSDILLVDEPTGNLDEENSVKIFEILKELSKTKTIIVVSHDTENAWKYGDNIYEIKNQKVDIIKADVNESSNNYDVKNTVLETKSKSYLKNKLGVLGTFTKSDLKKKKITLFLVALTTFLFLITLLFSFFFRLAIIDIDPQKLSSSNFDVAVISKKKNFDDDELKDKSFTQRESDLLKNDENVGAVIDIQPFRRTPQLSFNGRIISNDSKRAMPFEEISDTEFFKNRLEKNGLTGRIVENLNEIVLGKSIANQINEPDLIGKEIFFDPGVDGFSGRNLKIVGINNAKTSFNDYVSYVHVDLYKQPRELKNTVLFRPETLNQNLNNVKDIINLPIPKLIDKTEKIVSGVLTTNLDSLLVSTKIVELWKQHKINVRIGLDFILGYYNDLQKTIPVTGIFESDLLEIRTTQETIDSILNKKVTSKRIYVNQIDDLSFVFQNIEKLDPDFNLVQVFGERRFEIVLNTGIITLVFQLVFSVLFLLSIVSFFTMSLILTKSKKRDMMIMKMLGAKLWQIIYYSFGSFWVVLWGVLVVFIITSLGLAPLVYNLTLGDLDYTSLFYDRLLFWLFFIWLVTFIFFTFVYLLSSVVTNTLSYRKLKR